jgi:hypothetical protein
MFPHRINFIYLFFMNTQCSTRFYSSEGLRSDDFARFYPCIYVCTDEVGYNIEYSYCFLFNEIQVSKGKFTQFNLYK